MVSAAPVVAGATDRIFPETVAPSGIVLPFGNGTACMIRPLMGSPVRTVLAENPRFSRMGKMVPLGICELLAGELTAEEALFVRAQTVPEKRNGTNAEQRRWRAV